MPRYDYVIVGSGIAGLYAALLAREHGSVLLLTKGSIEESNTRWAQGGIAAPIGDDDSPDLHLADTLRAGAGLVDEEAARVLVDNAADAIADLVRLGVPFDTVDGEMILGREGAHSVNRVVHAGGDATGAHIELTLSQVAKLSGMTILEYAQAVDLVVEDGVVVGLTAMDTRSRAVETYLASFTILATGGMGQMYRVTTNPVVATGDGVAMAYRAGAEVADMEFFQFHPTALRLPDVPVFLISEAVRGEGGVLRNGEGATFMDRYHELGDLAPRDVVARSILTELKESGGDHVFLDVTHLDPKKVRARFPQIYKYCAEHGLDITTSPIPVSPAAHYMMGGVRTTTWGETTLPNLYACGECANTGVHGANRLASNSLLETVVFAKRAVQRSVEAPGAAASPTAEVYPLSDVLVRPERVPPPTLAALQDLMWRDVGIVRSLPSLAEAYRQLGDWEQVAAPPADRPSQELRNLLLGARLATQGALMRTESRGAHYRTDYPEPKDNWLRHIVFRAPA